VESSIERSKRASSSGKEGREGNERVRQGKSVRGGSGSSFVSLTGKGGSRGVTHKGRDMAGREKKGKSEAGLAGR
jgi:hypothetical protein